MVSKVNKDAFMKLKKLSIQKRLEVVDSPVGASMLALLTPSQFADLFPDYYRRGLPDVSGFREAISRKSQRKQQDILEGLSSGQSTSVEEAEKRGRSMREGTTPRGEGGSYTGPIKGWWTAERQKFAVQYLMEHGKFTQYGAAAAVARMTKEAPGGPGDSNNIGGGHWGIAQWGLSRGGRAMAGASFEQQLAHYVEESWGKEKAAGDRFRSAKSAADGAYAAASFERAEGWAESGGRSDVLMHKTPVDTVFNNAFGGGAGTTPASATGGDGSTSAMVGKAFRNAKGNTECAAYAQMGGGVGHTSGWKPGQAASSGGLKKGDWVATFGEGGRYTNTYGESHVARFEGYVYDEKGKIIGMNVTHQYNKSGGVIPGKFMFGSGGEFDASKYHQIVDRGNPASMSVADGSDSKVQAREKFYKENPQADGTDQVSKTEAKVDVKPAIQVAPPPPHPASSQSADLNETIKLHKENYLNEVIKKHPAAEAPIVGPGRTGVWKQTIDGLKKAGVPFKQTADGLEINVSRQDKRYKDAIKDMRDNELDPKQFLDKVKYTPGVYTPDSEQQPTASTSSQAMKSKIEQYYGQKISNHEYEMLIRATHAESTAKRHSPEEHAMIMGTILNRAKSEGGIEKALMRNKQFESVTGRTRGKFSPNPAYKAGPSADRLGSIYEGAMKYLDRVPENQKYFASATKTTKFLKRDILPGKFGTPERHADTWFGTSMKKEVAPEVKVAQAPAAPSAVPVDQTKPQEATPTTPKPAVEPAKPTSTAEKIAKEFFPGGGTHAQAAPAKPAETTTPKEAPKPTTTPTATPTPVTPQLTGSEKVAGVTGAATGGAFDVGDGGIKAFSIDGLRGDNTLVVNKKEEPLFTMNSSEPAIYDPSRNRVDVVPKTDGNAMSPSVDGIRSEFDALRQEMNNKLAGVGKPPEQQQIRPIQETRNDMPSFINDLVNQNKTPYHNPAAQRAYARTRFGENTTRDPTNDYTFGNTSV